MLCSWPVKFASMDQDGHVEKILRCRKCYRAGTATWEVTEAAGKVLVLLSEGFHRRPRFPLNLPPEILCDCGAVASDHD